MTPHMKLLNTDKPYVEEDLRGIHSSQSSLISDAVHDPELDPISVQQHLPRKSTLRKSIVQALTDLNPLKNKTKLGSIGPILDWVNLYHEGRVTASVLIAVELIEINFSTNLVPTVEYVTGIPSEIAPEMVQLK